MWSEGERACQPSDPSLPLVWRKRRIIIEREREMTLVPLFSPPKNLSPSLSLSLSLSLSAFAFKFVCSVFLVARDKCFYFYFLTFFAWKSCSSWAWWARPNSVLGEIEDSMNLVIVAWLMHAKFLVHWFRLSFVWYFGTYGLAFHVKGCCYSYYICLLFLMDCLKKYRCKRLSKNFLLHCQYSSQFLF